MAEPEPVGAPNLVAGPSDRLLVRSLAAFHTAILMIALVAITHASGDLDQLFGGLGTGPGIGLYLALWATTTWTTGRAMRGNLAAQMETWGWFSSIQNGILWSSVNGVAFDLALGAVILGKAILPPSHPEDLGDVFPTIFFLLVGSVVAVVVGAIIGLAMALIDRFAVSLGLAMALPMVTAADGSSPGPATVTDLASAAARDSEANKPRLDPDPHP